jgi:hypothetical protein
VRRCVFPRRVTVIEQKALEIAAADVLTTT